MLRLQSPVGHIMALRKMERTYQLFRTGRLMRRLMRGPGGTEITSSSLLNTFQQRHVRREPLRTRWNPITDHLSCGQRHLPDVLLTPNGDEILYFLKLPVLCLGLAGGSKRDHPWFTAVPMGSQCLWVDEDLTTKG